jgi:hypothetical protein
MITEPDIIGSLPEDEEYERLLQQILDGNFAYPPCAPMTVQAVRAIQGILAGLRAAKESHRSNTTEQNREARSK